MVTIRCVSHVCYNVSDLERSIVFYRDTLGMPVAFDFFKPGAARHGVYLHAGERTFIELFAGEVGPPSANASFRHVCLEVEDIEATVGEIRKSGVEVSEPKMGEDGSYQAWIKDPDGNSIELHQFAPDSRQANALRKLS